jgi:hypothetical protein
MKKAFALLPSALIVMTFFVGTVALANTVYTAPNGTQYSVPTGYQQYSSYGVFYNPSTGQYYDAYTGSVSTIQPAGPAATNQNGLYVIPAGYSSSSYGTYYGGSNGVYYDPITGFMSYTQPSGPTILGTVPNYYGTNYNYNIAATYQNPPLPNTGAGGDAATTGVVLFFSAAIALGGITLIRRTQRA